MMMYRFGGSGPYGAYYAGGGDWMMGIGLLVNLLLIGLIIFAAVRFISGRGIYGYCGGHPGHGRQGLEQSGRPEAAGGNRAGDNSAAIVRERYAKGEITKEQYLEMMEIIKQ